MEGGRKGCVDEENLGGHSDVWLTNKYDYNNTEITEVNLSVFVYRLFREDYPPPSVLQGTEQWREIFTKQPVDKYR